MLKFILPLVLLGCTSYAGTTLEDRFDKSSFNLNAIALKYGTKIRVIKKGFYEGCTGVLTKQYKNSYAATLSCDVKGGTYNNIETVVGPDAFEVVQ